MEKGSWACTVFTQVCVCVALYVSFHLGLPREEASRGYDGMIRIVGGGHGGGDGDVGAEVYFITVRGCIRPEIKQNRVLKLMEKVARAYRVGFVVDISEDGEDDVLLQKGAEYYRSLKIPWYITKSSAGGEQHYIQQIEIMHGKTLTLVGVVASFSMGLRSAILNEGPRRLVRTLTEANSQWNIYVGLHPSISCQNNSGQVDTKDQLLDSFYDVFPRYGVNAYLSGRASADRVCQDGLNYIANPDPWNMSTDSASLSSATSLCRDLDDGILLHRVNSQEIATYFINLSGKEFYRIIIQKRSRGVM
ncbi:hypothetical protein MLD38_005650 [Melastoma candidum]|uniref:Uncharacterized protein n=1 Tax=Melastoma candidum TaxID=119954 RepID=A0ACB9RJQ9_9MYRT|nr:hypothetical protein MLD38_005650 [Melastoma candidum]